MVKNVGTGDRAIRIVVALGLVGAIALHRLIEKMLFGVSATDPLTLSLISLGLSSIVLLACYIPARRAARVDPMIALKCE